MGRPVWTMGFEPGLCSVAAPATCPVALRARMRRCRLPTVLPAVKREEEQMRDIALDVHIDFCEVAIAEAGEVRSAGRISTKPEELELFAGSLAATDRVALEVTGNAWAIKRIIEPHVAEVIVVSPNDIGIRGARAKTDRLDARTLARLLAAGELEGVWMPDRETQVMRRRLGRRTQLVRSRARAKNEIHATLMRCLVGRAPFREPFGPKGRRWLAELDLPAEERESVDAALREIDRFASPRKLTGYLGLDPRVSQSGSAPATHGRISKQGSVSARHALVEASWSAVRQPGPMHAFYGRIRARRGHSIAIVACARKLACLFWCLLTREEDYAYAQPSLTAKKLRLLEIRAGSPSHKGVYTGTFVTRERMRAAERELAAQAESAYTRMVAEWQRTQTKRGAGATPGRASQRPSMRQAARQVQAP